MTSTSRIAAVLLFSLLFFSTAFAQTPRQEVLPVETTIDAVQPKSTLPQKGQVSALLVMAIASSRQLRIISVGEAQETRLQVFSSTGEQVFDSGFRFGNLVEWQTQNQQPSGSVNGTYLFLVTVKDFADHLTQKYGTAIIDQEQLYLEQTNRDELQLLQSRALEANRKVETLSVVDRIGAVGGGHIDLTIAQDSVVAGGRVSGAASGSITTAGGDNVLGSGTVNRLTKWADNSGSISDSTMTETNGKVGVGITNPSYKFVIGPDIGFGLVAADLTISRGAGQSVSAYIGPTAARGMEFGWDEANSRAFLNAPANTPITFLQGGPERMRIDAAGNIGIGTLTPQSKLDVTGAVNVTGNMNVTGNAVVAGNIAAKYQDVAEWVPASGRMITGTVVVLDSRRTNAVMPSIRTYDTHVAGVVSAQPGVILGQAGADKVMVATTGRVKVRVDATRRPIRVGDLLVTSGKEGMAMRSLPVRAGGTLMHRPGTIIGKALEPLLKGKGEILVLLSLQ